MEPNNSQATIAKKFWHMVRVAIFMLKKGISKSKLLANLNLIIMKRGKIAGKAIHNLMFHHDHHMSTTSDDLFSTTTIHRHLDEYEFSCSNTPKHHYFNLFKRKNHHQKMLTASDEDNNEAMTADALMKAMEMLKSETASPGFPGFGRSPLVRQLKITDSPFPLNYGNEQDNEVDEAADEFIKKFYKNLRKQNLMADA